MAPSPNCFRTLEVQLDKDQDSQQTLHILLQCSSVGSVIFCFHCSLPLNRTDPDPCSTVGMVFSSSENMEVVWPKKLSFGFFQTLFVVSAAFLQTSPGFYVARFCHRYWPCWTLILDLSFVPVQSGLSFPQGGRLLSRGRWADGDESVGFICIVLGVHFLSDLLRRFSSSLVRVLLFPI